MNRKEFVDNKIENNIKIRDNKIDDELRIGFDSEKKENTENKKNKISGIAYNIVRVIAFTVAGIAFGYASYELMDSYLDYTAAQKCLIRYRVRNRRQIRQIQLRQLVVQNTREQ